MKKLWFGLSGFLLLFSLLFYLEKPPSTVIVPPAPQPTSPQRPPGGPTSPPPPTSSSPTPSPVFKNCPLGNVDASHGWFDISGCTTSQHMFRLQLGGKRSNTSWSIRLLTADHRPSSGTFTVEVAPDDSFIPATKTSPGTYEIPGGEALIRVTQLGDAQFLELLRQ